jgi:hypothetical protein
VAFARRRGRHRGYQDQLAVGPWVVRVVQGVDPRQRHLGLGVAVGNQCFFGDAQAGRDLRDALQAGGLGDVDVGGDGGQHAMGSRVPAVARRGSSQTLDQVIVLATQRLLFGKNQ